MRAIKMKALVGSDHTVHLKLPDDVGEGPAEVIVLVDEVSSESDRAGTLAEFFTRHAVDSRFERTKDEIDADLRAERDSWE